MDLGDITANLEWSHPQIQAQGFSALLHKIRTIKNDRRAKEELIDYFFSRLNTPSASWLPFTAPSLVADGLIECEDLWAECLRRLSGTSTPVDVKNVLIATMFASTKDATDFTSLTLRIVEVLESTSQRLLLAHLKGLESRKFIPIVVALLHHKKVADELRSALLNYVESIWPNETFQIVIPAIKRQLSRDYLLKATEYTSSTVELVLQSTHCYALDDLTSTLKMDSEHAFHLYEVVSRLPPHIAFALLSNKTFPKHPGLFPALLVLASSVREFSSKGASGFGLSTENQQSLKTLVASTQKCLSTFSKTIPQDKDLSNLNTYFLWLCGDSHSQRIFEFLSVWSAQKTSSCFSSHVSASMLASLSVGVCDEHLPTFLDVLVTFIEDRLDLANDFIIFCMTLFATTAASNEFRRTILLKTLVRLTVHHMALTPVLKFLIAMCQQKKSVLMLELLGDLFEKHERIYPNVVPFLSVDLQTDSLPWNRAKMDLIRRVCRVSEKSEDLLDAISKVLNDPEGPFFVDAIFALADMCRMEIIDFEVIRKQLRKKYDVSVESVVAYIDLLSTAATNSEKATVWSSAFAELWKRALEDDRSEVKAAAWKALTSFNLAEFKENGECFNENIALSGPGLMDIFAKMRDRRETEAFIGFARKLLHLEIESFGRALYTKSAVEQRHDPFNGTIRLLRELISDDTRFRLGMIIPVCSHISNTTTRAERILHIFTDALVKNEGKSCDDFAETMQYYAEWKNAVQACFDVQLATGALTPLRIRDQLTAALKNSLQEAPCALINSLIALPFIATISSKLIRSDCSDEERTNHEKWQISALEFLLNATSFKYKLRGQPLFRYFEKEKVRRSVVITSFSGISAMLLLDLVPSHLITSHFGVTKENLLADFISKNCPKSEWIQSSVVGMLLHNRTINVNDIQGYSHFTVTLLGYVVDASSPVIDTVLDAIPNEETAESVLGCEAVTQAFERFLVLNDALQQKVLTQFAKKMEKLCRANKDSHAEVVRGLIKYQISQATRDSSRTLPEGYESILPEASVLRSVVARMRESSDSSAVTTLGNILINQQRSDRRRLPPMNWAFLLTKMDFENCEDFYCTIFQLAAEQKAAKVLCKLSSTELLNRVAGEIRVAATIADNFDGCVGVIPSANMSALVRHLVVTCGTLGWNSSDGERIASNLAKLANHDNTSRIIVSECLPKLPNMSAFVKNVVLFKRLQEVDRLQALNDCMVTEFWALVKNGKKLDLPLIYESLKSMSPESRTTCLLMFAYCTGTTPRLEDLVATGFDLVSVKVDEKNVNISWNLFLCLAVSTHVVPFPVTVYAAGDKKALEIQQKFALKYFETFLMIPGQDLAFKSIVRFLVNVLLTNTVENVEDAELYFDKADVRECLKKCISVNSEASIRTITEAGLFNDLFS